MQVLLLTPPMTQLNTPYPATAYLTAFLRGRGISVTQSDPAIDLVLRLFSKSGLLKIESDLRARFSGKCPRPPSVAWFLENVEAYTATIDSVIRFLQSKDPSLATRIASRAFLPEGPRFVAVAQAEALDENESLAWAFGALGAQDQAKYLASVYLDDLADVVREGIDERFELSRYAEKLSASAATFDAIAARLSESLAKPTLVETFLREITREVVARVRPDVVGLSVPFPGNVYGAFLIAQTVRAFAREKGCEIRVVMGGGYVNTELRSLRDARVFDYFDAVTLDDGERPFLNFLEGKPLVRTFVREGGGADLGVGAGVTQVVYKNDPSFHDFSMKEVGAPSYEGLRLDSYLSIFEMLNPMHRIWSDGRWNKLTLAHGCYWKKCNFCDVTLDYIGRYDPAAADAIVDRMEALIRETGQTGFHFVDEAAPPALLKAMAERLIARGVVVSWWGNVRFEKAFTPEVAELLARSGCIAVSGGLEVASDRLLKLMNKGVTIEQVARVTQALTLAGIRRHAYLMYGFPTQTIQETVDALEVVRQLFEAGCIQSAYWHRFSATVHSPIGRTPEKFGIRLLARPEVFFAENDLPFADETGVDHDALGVGLKRALYNFMHGIGFDQGAHKWFAGANAQSTVQSKRVPRAKIAADVIAKALG